MNWRLKATTLLGATVFALAGCDMLADKAAVEMLKASLKAVCGDEDKACIAAVETQFEACHEKYRSEWKAFMDSEGEDEALLDAYNDKVTGCIVDENGNPYFDSGEDASGVATDADSPDDAFEPVKAVEPAESAEPDPSPDERASESRQ